MKKGGVVIFHDCTPAFGVHKFVTEDLAVLKHSWRIEYAKMESAFGHSRPAMAEKL